MNDDTISRRAAIDRINKQREHLQPDIYPQDKIGDAAYRICAEFIERLPSAQPKIEERKEESAQNVPKEDLISRNAAIEAMSESLKRVFPEHRQIAEKCLKALPSAQPVGASMHDSSTDYAHGFADGYKNGLKDAQPEPQWIPVSKKSHPDTPERVQVQLDNGWIITAYYEENEWLSVPYCDEPIEDKWIEAWIPLPEPYAERRTDDLQ